MKYREIYDKLFNTYSTKKYLMRLLFDNTFKCNILLDKVKSSKGKLRRYFLANKLQRKYNCIISINARIGKNLILKHPIGVVIGEGVNIGNDVIIYQNVTIGQKKGKYPTIGDGCIIYPNSVIVGDIVVGKNSVIGACCFVDFNINSEKIYGTNRAFEINRKV